MRGTRLIWNGKTWVEPPPAPPRPKLGKEGWPRKSLALAVGPKARRRKEFYDSSVRKGVPTHTDSIGRPIFTSQAHQRAYLKAYGKHQLNSFS